MSPLTVDGGTRFVIQLRGGLGWKPVPELVAILTQAREAALARRKKITVELPAPQLELFGENKPMAEVKIGGLGGAVFRFHVADQCYGILNTDTGQFQLQLKAKLMWSQGAGAQGYEAAARYWIGAWTYMLTSRTATLEIARRVGWKMTGLELCGDFVQLDLGRGDMGNFVGARSNGDDGTPTDEDEDLHENLTERVTVWGGVGDAIQTGMIGKRSSPFSMCIYDKRQQIDAAKGGDGSTYEAIHYERGWDGESKITRVEARFNGRALIFEDVDTGEVLDFTDPMTATSPEKLAMLWAVATNKRRLIDPTTATRRKRCKVDPRWEAVQAAAGMQLELDSSWRQQRQVALHTHEVRERRSRAAALKGLARYAALTGLDVSTDAGLLEVLRDAIETAPDDLDVLAYLDEYAKVQAPMLHVEIGAARVRFTDRAESRRARVQSRRASAASRSGPSKSSDQKPTSNL